MFGAMARRSVALAGSKNTESKNAGSKNTRSKNAGSKNAGPRKPKAAKTPKAPRRAPTQERSRATVQFIIEAATRLIRDKGEFGMHDAARVAGVSAASIYQYFPTREALMAACEESALEELLASLAARSMQLHQEAAPVGLAIEEIVRLAFVLFRQHADQFGTLYQDDFPSRKSARHAIIQQAVQVSTATLRAMAEREPRLRRPDLPTACATAVRVVATCAYVTTMQKAEADMLAQELPTMVRTYLLSPPGQVPPLVRT
jgi:AcrR family transcriptional regulator